jgi:subtilisin family serine protease
VIDSGVDGSHRWLKGVAGGAGFELVDGQRRLVPDAYDDLFGHGTAVASLIHAFCPEADLYAVRLASYAYVATGLGSPPMVSSSASELPYLELGVPESGLAQAIDWCVERGGIQVVNMSYSLDATELDTDGPLSRACRGAWEQGVTVVSSYGNRKNAMSFPAALATVIGVRRSLTLPPGRVEILSAENRDVAAWGGPVRTAFLKDTVSHVYGTSLSSAHVAAMIGRMYLANDRIGPDEAFGYLKQVSSLSDRSCVDGREGG